MAHYGKALVVSRSLNVWPFHSESKLKILLVEEMGKAMTAVCRGWVGNGALGEEQ